LATFISKNMSVASIKPDIWMILLAEWMGFPNNKDGVMATARDFQIECRENIQTIDTALWNWAKRQPILAR